MFYIITYGIQTPWTIWNHSFNKILCASNNSSLYQCDYHFNKNRSREVMINKQVFGKGEEQPRLKNYYWWAIHIYDQQFHTYNCNTHRASSTAMHTIFFGNFRSCSGSDSSERLSGEHIKIGNFPALTSCNCSVGSLSWTSTSTSTSILSATTIYSQVQLSRQH